MDSISTVHITSSLSSSPRSVLLLAGGGARRRSGDERVGTKRVGDSGQGEERDDDVEGDGGAARVARVGEGSALEHLHRVGVDEGEP